jgi:hypothetical protein
MAIILQINYASGNGQDRLLEFRVKDSNGDGIKLMARNIGPDCYDIPDLIAVIPSERLIGVDLTRALWAGTCSCGNSPSGTYRPGQCNAHCAGRP